MVENPFYITQMLYNETLNFINIPALRTLSRTLSEHYPEYYTCLSPNNENKIVLNC